MGKLIRCITSDGLVMATALDSTDIVARAESLHKTSAVVTAALGRLLTATSLMGNALKDEKSTITVKIDGNGPSGAVIAVADSRGDVRGYAVNPVVEIPLKENGKLYSVMTARFTGENKEMPEYFYYTGKINPKIEAGYLYIQKQYSRILKEMNYFLK